MERVLFDLESNGLLPDLTKIHCIALGDPTTGDRAFFGPDNIVTALEILSKAKTIIGHNIIDFDLRALQKVYPQFKPKATIRDTLVLSRLLWPDIKQRDQDLHAAHKKKHEKLVSEWRAENAAFERAIEQGSQDLDYPGPQPVYSGFPGQLIGRHSLESWGHRLGLHKGDYKKEMEALGLDPWAEYNAKMGEYCELDREVNLKLWQKCLEKAPALEAVELEHAVWKIILRQQDYGFSFDKEAAGELMKQLRARSRELESELQEVFPPWWINRGEFIPKRDNKPKGYVKGVPLTKIELQDFNPGSRDQIANRLIANRGWKPKKFTESGKPVVDEEVLGELPWSEAKLLTEYLTVGKRLGQLSDGAEGWMRAEKNGRIHGRVNPNGTVTARMTHSKPNVGQVPSVETDDDGNPILGYAGGYGYECRSLFRATPGRVLVGCDADSLELRCLAGYMAKYDGGEYVKVILEGDKSKGTDMHSRNAKILGCSRKLAKRWFYAFIYGGGDYMLGAILGGSAKVGAQSRAAFLKALPALKKIIEAVKKDAKRTGYITALDGRKLRIRSEHSAFNMLLQSAGSLLMKRAIVILDEDLQSAGYAPGADYEFVANIHDEWQIETRKEIAEDVGKRATDAIRRAGEYYGFRCPLAGDSSVGRTWAETH